MSSDQDSRPPPPPSSLVFLVDCMIERFIHQGMVDKAQTFEQEHQLAAKLLQNFLSVMEPTAMQTQPEISQ